MQPPLQIQSGVSHRLTVDCVYDASSRSTETHGGDATEDEMCLVALMYYPRAAALDDLLVDTVSYIGDGSHTCGCPGGAVATSGGGSATAAVDPKHLAHGALMLVAWGLLLPLGGLLPRTWRDALPDGGWLRVHRGLQSAGLLLSLAGFAVSVAMVSGSHFDASCAPPRARPPPPPQQPPPRRAAAASARGRLPRQTRRTNRWASSSR